MMKFVFVAIVLLWCFVGFVGGLTAKDNHTNWWMIAFMGVIPAMPFLAKLCGLL